MQNIVAKGWGFELHIVNNNKYCGKQLTVLQDKWCSVHYHLEKDEDFWVLDGELRLEVGKWEALTDNLWYDNYETIILKKGQSYHISTKIPHRFTSNVAYPTTFIEFSTTHRDEDSYRIIKGD